MFQEVLACSLPAKKCLKWPYAKLVWYEHSSYTFVDESKNWYKELCYATGIAQFFVPMHSNVKNADNMSGKMCIVHELPKYDWTCEI